MSIFDFSTLYTTLPHDPTKEKLTESIEQTFDSEDFLYLACKGKSAIFTSEKTKKDNLGLCQKVCDALHHLLYNIIIRYGS